MFDLTNEIKVHRSCEVSQAWRSDVSRKKNVQIQRPTLILRLIKNCSPKFTLKKEASFPSELGPRKVFAFPREVILTVIARPTGSPSCVLLNLIYSKDSPHTAVCLTLRFLRSTANVENKIGNSQRGEIRALAPSASTSHSVDRRTRRSYMCRALITQLLFKADD